MNECGGMDCLELVAIEGTALRPGYVHPLRTLYNLPSPCRPTSPPASPPFVPYKPAYPESSCKTPSLLSIQSDCQSPPVSQSGLQFLPSWRQP